ncbi:MAG: RipA family octameric membrane protein [Acidobacteriaceae bacterium]
MRLQTPLEIRQFEIELYWKRATYFWTLLAATFAGYFALAASDKFGVRPGLLFLVSCIGLVLSTSWYLVNRGSKYWQENWERHVDSLEDEFAGPLYKTTISNEQFCWFKPWDGYPFSVSKVNQLSSFFVALLWLALAISSFPSLHLPTWLVTAKPYILAVITLIFLVLLIWKGRGGSQGKRREVDFYKSDLD